MKTDAETSAAAHLAMARAVRKAVLWSLAAEVLALLTGRIPWFSLVLVIASVSYLVEAIDQWRSMRSLAQDEADLRLIDEQIALENGTLQLAA